MSSNIPYWLILVGLQLTQLPGLAWTRGAELPAPVSNNAVAAVRAGAGGVFLSLAGLDSTKVWTGVSDQVFRWSLGESGWKAVAPVPGPGRLAATAQTVRGKVYLLGGYTVAEDGAEKSLPHVEVLDPISGKWSRGEPIPVPVDDAVSGVWRDSLIFLVSGWHDSDNVDLVQIYDPQSDRWQQATPIPGPPVFGHAGTVVGDFIVYLGGVRTNSSAPRFEIEDSAWLGTIDPERPTHIEWKRLDDPPGPPLYRAASGAWRDLVLFAGGTDNPYNYNGIGYDGERSHPSDGVFAYSTSSGAWLELTSLPEPSMDHRSLAVLGDTIVLVGGMRGAARVVSDTWIGFLR